MSLSTKISISLPRSTLERADRERRAAGESRSQFFRRAVEEYLRQKKQREQVERYVAGYVAEPESEYEEEVAERAAAEVLDEEPWE